MRFADALSMGQDTQRKSQSEWSGTLCHVFIKHPAPDASLSFPMARKGYRPGLALEPRMVRIHLRNRFCIRRKIFYLCPKDEELGSRM